MKTIEIRKEKFLKTTNFFSARTSTTMRMMAPITPKTAPKMMPVHTKHYNNIIVTLEMSYPIRGCIFQ